MLPLVRFAGLAPGSIKGSDGENLCIESTRIGAGKDIARVVRLLVLENNDRLIDQRRVNQGTIRSDAHHSVGWILMRGLIITIQNVTALSPESTKPASDRIPSTMTPSAGALVVATTILVICWERSSRRTTRAKTVSPPRSINTLPGSLLLPMRA